LRYPLLITYPGYLKRFHPGDIYHLSFHSGGFTKPNELLEVMTQLKGVQELDLTGDRDLTPDCSTSIENMIR